MNQSLCMLLINFSSPRLQDLQRIGMGEPSEFFEQLYYRMIISTMGRQEIRVMSTRRGYLVPLTPSSVGENNWLFISVYKKNDINITNFLRHIFSYQHASSLDFSN